jgi:uncharacterized protein (DUF2236 family)
MSERELGFDPALLPGPGSIVRRRITDPRVVAAAGYALALQAAHPAVAAGVRDHSNFAADPWGRFFRTADYVIHLAYGDVETVTTLARKLRDAHRPIRGIDAHGNRYSALEPMAYAWVHATIAASIVHAHDHMGMTFRSDEREEFWSQWLVLGDVLGVRRSELPSTWSALDAYITHMIDTVLEDNDIIQSLRTKARYAVGGTPFRWLPDRAWAAAGVPLGRLLYFLGNGMLPPVLRDRFGFRWTPRHERAFAAYCAASKAATPLVPRLMRESGPLALRIRRREVGPFGIPNSEARVAG